MERWYDKEEDILNVQLENKEYWKSIELPNGIIIDVAKDGSITGIEILRASKVFSGDVKKVIETAKIATQKEISEFLEKYKNLAENENR